MYTIIPPSRRYHYYIFLSFLLFKKNFWCLFIYLFIERERAWVEEGQRERRRHRIQSRLQALSCQHRAWCGARTHKSWDCDLNRSRILNWLSHPGAPSFFPFYISLSLSLSISINIYIYLFMVLYNYDYSVSIIFILFLLPFGIHHFIHSTNIHWAIWHMFSFNFNSIHIIFNACLKCHKVPLP